MNDNEIKDIKTIIKSEIDQHPSYADVRCVAMNIAYQIGIKYFYSTEEELVKFLEDCGCDEEYLSFCFGDVETFRNYGSRD